MALKLNGKPFSPLQTQSQMAEKITAFLAKSSADDLYTSDELAKKLGLKSGFLVHNGRREQFQKVSHKCGTNRYWGSEKAIAALRKELGL